MNLLRKKHEIYTLKKKKKERIDKCSCFSLFFFIVSINIFLIDLIKKKFHSMTCLMEKKGNVELCSFDLLLRLVERINVFK